MMQSTSFTIFIYAFGVSITIIVHIIASTKPPRPPSMEEALCLTTVTSLSQLRTGKAKFMVIP